MHHILRFVVKAQDKKEALQVAKGLLDNVAGEGRDVDYGAFFDDAGTSVSGAGRWGKMEPAMPLLSPSGMALLLTGFSADYERMSDGFKEVKEMLKKDVTLDEIYDDMMMRYRFKMVGGRDEFVYHQDYGFITAQDMSVDDWTELWIVPCDVHT